MRRRTGSQPARSAESQVGPAAGRPVRFNGGRGPTVAFGIGARSDRHNGDGVPGATRHPLLRRSTVLQGRRSALPYMHAESLLVPSRLPAAFCLQLETTSDPIGRILAKEGIGFTRSPLPRPDRRHGSVFGDAPVPDEHLLARTYRIDVDGVPIMVIGEWFLPTLESFLGPS